MTEQGKVHAAFNSMAQAERNGENVHEVAGKEAAAEGEQEEAGKEAGKEGEHEVAGKESAAEGEQEVAGKDAAAEGEQEEAGKEATAEGEQEVAGKEAAAEGEHEVAGKEAAAEGKENEQEVTGEEAGEENEEEDETTPKNKYQATIETIDATRWHAGSRRHDEDEMRCRACMLDILYSLKTGKMMVCPNDPTHRYHELCHYGAAMKWIPGENGCKDCDRKDAPPSAARRVRKPVEPKPAAKTPIKKEKKDVTASSSAGRAATSSTKNARASSSTKVERGAGKAPMRRLAPSAMKAPVKKEKKTSGASSSAGDGIKQVKNAGSGKKRATASPSSTHGGKRRKVEPTYTITEGMSMTAEDMRHISVEADNPDERTDTPTAFYFNSEELADAMLSYLHKHHKTTMFIKLEDDECDDNGEDKYLDVYENIENADK